MKLDDYVQFVDIPTLISLLMVVVSEMTYTVSSGTLNSTIPYHTQH